MERARNRDALYACGDPERWGGQSVVSLPVDPTRTSDLTFGPQLLRAQTRDLIAVGWDLIASWEVSGIATALGVTTDTVDLFLEIALGTGQASTQLLFQLVSIGRGVPIPPLTSNPASAFNGIFAAPINAPGAGQAFGIAQTAYPIPAVAMNVRPLLQGSTTAASHTLTARITAHIAPRGYPV